MHAAIVFRQLHSYRPAKRLRSHDTVLSCGGMGLGFTGGQMMAAAALFALFLGWVSFRLSGIPISGVRFFGRHGQARRRKSPADGAASRDAASADDGDAGQVAVAAAVPRNKTLIMMVAVVVALTALVALMPDHCDYTVRARVSELILAGSGYRSAITEKFEAERDPANAGSGLNFNTVGKISGGSVSRDGTIVINGSSAATSVKTDVTITITPSYNTGNGTVTWKCVGQPAKYMPATCR